MAIKELISRTSQWFGAKRSSEYEALRKVRDAVFVDEDQAGRQLDTEIVEADDKVEAIKMLEVSFGQLSDKLGGINENLSRQLTQNKELMERIDELPRLMKSFPDAMESQRQIVETLTEQLKVEAIKGDAFAEVVGRIPDATEKQTNAIVDMAGEMAASATVDAQMNERFGKFNSILDKLKDNVEGQTDGMIQMSKTFSASDRYLKYILSVQHKRFMWVFLTALGVCSFAIIVMLVVVLLIK